MMTISKIGQLLHSSGLLMATLFPTRVPLSESHLWSRCQDTWLGRCPQRRPLPPLPLPLLPLAPRPRPAQPAPSNSRRALLLELPWVPVKLPHFLNLIVQVTDNLTFLAILISLLFMSLAAFRRRLRRSRKRPQGFVPSAAFYASQDQFKSDDHQYPPQIPMTQPESGSFPVTTPTIKDSRSPDYPPNLTELEAGTVRSEWTT